MTAVYGASGSFTVVFGVCIGIDVVIGSLLLLAIRFAKNLKWEGSVTILS